MKKGINRRRNVICTCLIFAAMLLAVSAVAKEEFIDASLERGNAALKAESYEEALAIFDAALAEQPDAAAYHCGRGTALVNLDRLDEGIDALSIAMRLDPKNWEYPAERTVAYYRLGQLDKAFEDSRKAVGMEPDEPVGYANHAFYQIELRMFEEAVDTCASAIEKYPRDPELYRMLGVAYYCMGNNDRAYTACLTAIAYGIDYQPEFYPGYNDLAVEFPGMFIDATGQWSYELKDGNVTIMGCAGKEPSGQLTIPCEVDGYPVTAIGFAAFFKYRLTGITIPDSVTFIDEMAFEDCMLTDITIPDGVTGIKGNPFAGCPLTAFAVSPGNPAYMATDGVLFDKRNHTLVSFPGARTGEYEVPHGTVTLGDDAFSKSGGLTSLTLPHSVTRVGWGTFSYCGALTRIIIPGSVTDIGLYAFMDSDSVILNVERGSYALQYATDNSLQYTFEYTDATGQWKYELENGEAIITGGVEEEPTGDLVIPGEVDGYPVTVIGVGAFDWGSLASVIIPDSVTYISRYAFAYASASLTSITIPEGVTDINGYAFNWCTGLASVSLPDSLTQINGNPFPGCPITAFNVSPGNPAYTVTNGVLFDKRDYTLVAFPREMHDEYEIPQGTASIGDSAFEGCYNLTNITIPGSVTEIGDGAFSQCHGLTNVTIPGSVTGIGDFAFWECNNLASVTILDGVTSIRDNAFQNCNNLTCVTIPASVTDIGWAFDGCYDLILSVEKDSYAEQYAKDNGVAYTFIE